MEPSRLYLIFEFLSMDLKKYMDTLGSGKVCTKHMIYLFVVVVMLFVNVVHYIIIDSILLCYTTMF